MALDSSARADELFREAGDGEDWIDADPKAGRLSSKIDALDAAHRILAHEVRHVRFGWSKKNSRDWDLFYVLDRSSYSSKYWICTNSRKRYMALRKPDELLEIPPMSEVSARDIIRKLMAALERLFTDTAFFLRKEVMSEYKTMSVLGSVHSHFELSKIVDYHVDVATHEIDGFRVAPMATDASLMDDDDDSPSSSAAERSAGLSDDFKKISNCREMMTFMFDSSTIEEIGLDVPTIRSRVEHQIRHWYLLINKLQFQNRQLREKLKNPKWMEVEKWRVAAQQKEILEEMMRSDQEMADRLAAQLSAVKAERDQLRKQVSRLESGMDAERAAVPVASPDPVAPRIGSASPSVPRGSVIGGAGSMGDEVSVQESDYWRSEAEKSRTHLELLEEQIKEYRTQIEDLTMKLDNEKKLAAHAQKEVKNRMRSETRLSTSIDKSNAAYARSQIQIRQSMDQVASLKKELRELKIRFGVDGAEDEDLEEDHFEDEDEDSISDLEDADTRERKKHIRRMTRDQLEVEYTRTYASDRDKREDLENLQKDIAAERVELAKERAVNETLVERITHYEEVMEAHGIDIPPDSADTNSIPVVSTGMSKGIPSAIGIEAELGAYSDDEREKRDPTSVTDTPKIDSSPSLSTGGQQSSVPIGDITTAKTVEQKVRNLEEAVRRLRQEKMELQTVQDRANIEVNRLTEELSSLKAQNAELVSQQADAETERRLAELLKDQTVETFSRLSAEPTDGDGDDEMDDSQDSERLKALPIHYKRKSKMELLYECYDLSEDAKDKDSDLAQMRSEMADTTLRLNQAEDTHERDENEKEALQMRLTSEMKMTEIYQQQLEEKSHELDELRRSIAITGGLITPSFGTRGLSSGSVTTSNPQSRALPERQQVSILFEKLIKLVHAPVHQDMVAKLNDMHMELRDIDYYDIYINYLSHELLHNIMILSFAAMEDRLFLFTRCVMEIFQLSEDKAERYVRNIISRDWKKYVSNTYVVGAPLESDPELGQLRSVAEIRAGASGLISPPGVEIPAGARGSSGGSKSRASSTDEDEYSDEDEETLVEVKFSSKSIEETIANICDSINYKFNNWDFLGDPRIRLGLEQFTARCCEVCWALVLSEFDVYPRTTLVTAEEMKSNPPPMDLHSFVKSGTYLKGSDLDSDYVLYFAIPALIDKHVRTNIVVPPTVLMSSNDEILTLISRGGMESDSPLFQRIKDHHEKLALDIEAQEWESVGYGTNPPSPTSVEFLRDLLTPAAGGSSSESDMDDSSKPRRNSKLIGTGGIDTIGPSDAGDSDQRPELETLAAAMVAEEKSSVVDDSGAESGSGRSHRRKSSILRGFGVTEDLDDTTKTDSDTGAVLVGTNDFGESIPTSKMDSLETDPDESGYRAAPKADGTAPKARTSISKGWDQTDFEHMESPAADPSQPTDADVVAAGVIALDEDEQQSSESAEMISHEDATA